MIDAYEPYEHFQIQNTLGNNNIHVKNQIIDNIIARNMNSSAISRDRKNNYGLKTSRGTGSRRIESRDNPLWDSQFKSVILLNNNLSYRNSKKYHQLIDEYHSRQEEIKKLSTRTNLNLSPSNELGIKNDKVQPKLPNVSSSSYSLLTGFTIRNCSPEAKEIINYYNNKEEKEKKKQTYTQSMPQLNQNSRYMLYDQSGSNIRFSLSSSSIKNVNKNTINSKSKHIKDERLDLESTLVQKSLQSLVNCAKRTGRGLFCGV